MSESINRVCHITTVHPRFDVRIFYKECLSLSSFYNVYLIVADGKGDEVSNKIKIIDVYKKNNSRITRILFTTLRAYRKALEINCEIYHFHDPEFLFYGWMLQRKGKKVIYDVHEDVPKQILSKNYINPIFRKILSKLIMLIEKSISHRLSAIVTVTQSINKRFSDQNRQCFIINNYPDLKKFKASQVKNRSGVCYIGSISPERGLEMILQSLVSTNIEFHLAGKFDSEEFKNKLMAHPGWSKVIYYGLVDAEKAISIVKGSCAGLVIYLPVPNHLEAQPNKMFEYMAAGIPVIASDFPLWREIIEGNSCGICVNPLNPKEISNAIELLYDNPDMANTMGQNGMKAVNTTFSWKTEEQKLFEIYSNRLFYKQIF
jgi:glycosyltransferase involved in cell wall biosynthesis